MVWMDRGLTSAIDEAGTVLTEKASNLESSLNRICEESILQAERKPLDAEYASRFVCLLCTHTRLGKLGWFTIGEINQ